MKPIQIVLLALGGLLVNLYFARLRSLVVDRIIALALAAGVMTLIIVPDITTWAAHAVGVGRGVDLVIYLSLFLLTYMAILQYSKIRALETQVTDLVRALAIDEANTPASGVAQYPRASQTRPAA